MFQIILAAINTSSFFMSQPLYSNSKFRHILFPLRLLRLFSRQSHKASSEQRHKTRTELPRAIISHYPAGPVPRGASISAILRIRGQL
jgi:hypothetical protein